MWFKNLKIFRLNTDWSISADDLEEKLQTHAFVPGTPGKETNFGWVEPRNNGRLVYAVGKYFFLTLRAEKKLLPTTVINQFAREKAAEIEEQQGYKPGRKQMKEIKEMVTDLLIPKAFSIFKETRICLDLENHWMYIDAGTTAKADEVIALLVKALDPMPIKSFITQKSPTTVMTEALFTDQAPDGFTIDPQSELKSTQQDRASIRFANITPERDEITKHIENGKICTKLGMTWQDRISFILNENLEIKRITPLEVLDENKDNFSPNEDERFDADMTLMCSSLNILLQDLSEALGGLNTEK